MSDTKECVHSWDVFAGRPGTPTWEACWRCRVPRTEADRQRQADAK